MSYTKNVRTTASDTIKLLRQIMKSDYFILLKPRVMSLVVFTALVGLVIAPGSIGFWRSLLAIICIAMAGGGAGALNMWYEADIDALMERTKNRPLPQGRVPQLNAFLYGISLSLISVILMGVFVNLKSSLFLAFTIFFYVIIYTILLKRRTPQNIVIGGAAGAFPPMVAWVAATNQFGLGGFILFLIIFLWTPPHFWALSLYMKPDYEKAGIPMMPNIKGIDYTKSQILLYSIALTAVGILPYILNMAGYSYGILSTILGLTFLYKAWDLWRHPNNEILYIKARSLFKFSLIYLTAIFIVLLISNLLNI